MLNWRTSAPDPLYGLPPQTTTYVGRVGVLFNPTGFDKKTGKIVFTVGKRMTYSGPMKTVEEAKAYVEARADKLAAVKTMAQLLKVTAPEPKVPDEKPSRGGAGKKPFSLADVQRGDPSKGDGRWVTISGNRVYVKS